MFIAKIKSEINKYIELEFKDRYHLIIYNSILLFLVSTMMIYSYKNNDYLLLIGSGIEICSNIALFIFIKLHKEKIGNVIFAFFLGFIV